MTAFGAMLRMNLKRRACDGFAVGYNLIFPMVVIVLLGFLCQKISYGGISSFQYYTVVIIPFCILMAVTTAAYAGKDDAYAKTAQRVLLTPISHRAIVWSKIISCTLVIFLCSIIVYAGASLLFGIGFQGIWWVTILHVCLAFFVSAVGTFIGLGMKNFLVVKNVMNLPILLCAIFGGTFFKINTVNPVVNILMRLSPIGWVNRSLFLALYEKNSSLLILVVFLLAIAGLIGAALAVKMFKKGEYMNGSLPGYEK